MPLALSPVEVAARLRHLGGLVFFDTAGHVPHGVANPVSVVAAAPARVFRGSIHDAVAVAELRECLAKNKVEAGDVGFPLGGLCGWVDYEGDFTFGEYREMLIHVHGADEWWEIGSLSEKMQEPEDERCVVGEFDGGMGHEKFVSMVKRAKEWIAAGDIYQVNLSQAFAAEVSGGSLFSHYERLRAASPAPMGAWMELAGREVLSTSPELFLRVSHRGVETRPIKGTRPRFANADDDVRAAHELVTSQKEIAELVMITDLLRNDLGQVCEFGSVEVEEMCRLESLEQVHHLVSTVVGRLRPEVDALGALAACFPGGSITGAPKKRAMEIITELEGRRRGLYCGAIGWLGFNGESCLNIAIRTLVREGGRLVYQTGAGIVADSDPHKEYEETLHKAAGIRRVFGGGETRDGGAK